MQEEKRAEALKPKTEEKPAPIEPPQAQSEQPKIQETAHEPAPQNHADGGQHEAHQPQITVSQPVHEDTKDHPVQLVVDEHKAEELPQIAAN